MDITKGTLEAKNTKFIRLVWCDVANIIRAKAFPTNRLNQNTNISLPLAQATQAVTAIGHEVWLEPDWNTLVFPPYVETHASVMANITDQGEHWSLSTRAFLHKMVDKLLRFYGVTLKVGFRNTFYLLGEMAGEMETADSTPYASLEAINLQKDFLNALLDNLLAQNIEIRDLCSEAGPGQFGITLEPTDPLTVADQQIIFRETVHAVARQHGHIASFLPKIFSDTAGNGAYINFSLWENELNVTGVDSPSRLSEIAEYFMAGILYHLPALMAVTTPTCNSFRRIAPHAGVGAFAVWGHDNHEAAICVLSAHGSPYPVEITLQTCDVAANPYLALGSMIATGFNGIREKLSLDPEVTVDPATFTQSELEEKGIRPLHKDFWLALEDFRHDDILKEAMGMDLGRVYWSVKQAEWEIFKSLSLEDEVRILLESY